MLELREAAARARRSTDGAAEEHVGGDAVRLVRDEGDVVGAVARRVERAEDEVAARDRVAVGDALVGGDGRQRMSQQRRADARGDLGDVDDMIGVAVRAQHVRDRDPVTRGALLERLR